MLLDCDAAWQIELEEAGRGMDEEEPILYVNGSYVRLSEARISPLDQGFLLGDGVFDVVSAWKGRLFKLDQHIERFFQSLHAAGLETELDTSAWRELIVETVRRNRLQDASVRFIVTRGVPIEVVSDPRSFRPTVVVWAAPYIYLADEEKRKTGIRLSISSLRGFSPDTLDPRYKSLDRLHFQLARLEALAGGYDDVLWLNAHGYVAEGPASNVMVVNGGVLHTPGELILRGITRQTIIEIAQSSGIQVREGNLTAYDLYCADELFTVSTAGGPLPVREVNGRVPRASVPGPVTRDLTERYWTMRESHEHATAIYSES